MKPEVVRLACQSSALQQNRALKTTSFARAPTRAWWELVGPSSSLRWDPNRVRWDSVGPSSSLRGTQIGFGGTRWDPVGPSPSLRRTLHPFGFYNAN